jgi:hypothetical protein
MGLVHGKSEDGGREETFGRGQGGVGHPRPTDAGGRGTGVGRRPSVIDSFCASESESLTAVSSGVRGNSATLGCLFFRASSYDSDNRTTVGKNFANSPHFR